MKEQEKQLLLQDLCARLPYGTIIHGNFPHCDGDNMVDDIKDEPLTISVIDWLMNGIDGIKPYLRPIQSMTDEEMEDYARYKFLSDEIWEIVDFRRTSKGFINVNCKNRNDASEQWTFQVNQRSPLENYKGIDWLNTRHFDYRCLIEKGLALKAPEGMYNSFQS